MERPVSQSPQGIVPFNLHTSTVKDANIMPKITILLYNCIRDPQILNNSLFKQQKLYRSGNKVLRFLVFYVIGKKRKTKKLKFIP